MDAEIVENANLAGNWAPQRKEDGKFLPGQGGRPIGTKNKFTMVKEALIDAFFDAEGQEAFKNTLVYDELLAGADGKKKKLMNLEALRSVLRVLPREDQGIGNTYNFNIIVGELRKLPVDELRTFLAGRRKSHDNGSGESTSVQ